VKSDISSLTQLGVCGRFELLRGRRAGTGPSVLLKRCRDAGEDLGALRREIAIASTLSSAATLLPRIVESPPPAAVVMEDPGGELLAALLRNGRLPLETALAVGAQIAGALVGRARIGSQTFGLAKKLVT
jgi:hypothetical protein